MNKLSRYIPSLILSVLTVFAMLACIVTTVAKINITPEKFIGITRDENISEMVYSSLQKYWDEKYYSSHIPSSVYLDALTEDDVQAIVEKRINEGFTAMAEGGTVDPAASSDAVSDAVDKFFSDYADENSYDKDEAYQKQLRQAQENAASVIGQQCDVFKFSALSKHGVLSKGAKVYNNMGLFVACSYGLFAVLALLLVIVCRKEKKAVLYWLGISGIISGLFCGVPSAYLILSGYFNAFTIKQPQIFTAYTTALTNGTSAILAASIALIAAGIALLIVYAVASSKNKDIKPTDL